MRIALSVSPVWLVSCALLPSLSNAQDRAVLNEVVVSASRLREQEQIDVPASVTVLTEQALTDSAQQHFEEVLAQVPNLNWAAGSSRPRYFQIRGIGEREQYEGAPNSSVGFLIDDIDFSGVGMAATLFDVEQIEVLRGPQGTRLGANALAGLIAVRSADPEEEFAARAVLDLGNYDTGSFGFSVTGPVAALDSAWRVSVQQYKSDGFRTNAYLNREDTNGRDELTARGKWRWHAGESAQVDLTFLHVNLANGYDAFSIDNSRVTLSDQPGQDWQRVNAGAVKWSDTFSGGSTLTVLATAMDSTSVYGFDSDWGNPLSWAPYDYSYVDRADRGLETHTVEARMASAPAINAGDVAWLLGVYGRRLREAIDNTSNYSDPLHSEFAADTAAVFTEWDGRLSSQWVWAAGLRGEWRDAEYQDTRPTVDERQDTLGGGNASLTFEVDDSTRVFAAIARGYKAGGFNLGTGRELRPEFEPEFLWNYELGLKTAALDNRLRVDAVVFYMQRKNMQVRTGEQADPSNPGTYIFVTTNVAEGKNYGAELSAQWLPIETVQLGGSVGLLKTEMSGAVDRQGMPVPPRDQPHAPDYQVQLNATYRHSSGIMARLDWSAVDAFYFDVPTDHDQKSSPYELFNIKLGYESAHWSVHAWARNLFDDSYATRGFYFVNDPAPGAEAKLYIQNGDPRTYGVSAEWRLGDRSR